MYEEAIVGFDAREMQTHFSETWSADRLENFLLRTDLDRPLSTDDMVWESMFGRANTDIPDWADFRSVRLELPKWTGPRQATWENLELMQSFLREHQADLDGIPYWIIAITQCISPEEAAAWYPIMPPKVAPEWSRLGYDVSDYYLLSGLMNCGYRAEDGDVKGPWAGKLNCYHLFDKMQDALEFAQFSDGRIKEHAPFFAYGIYVIERVE